jgi:hypothetical protein
MRLHIEGMGLIGSLVAWQLRARNIDFTWNDTEAPFTAWHASTGCCYPSGGPDWECYVQWLEWLSLGSIYPSQDFTIAPYWVDTVHKSLPHGLQAETLELECGMRHVEHDSIHINAQAFVARTRQEFQVTRETRAPANADVLVSHGFTPRRDRYLWGWHALVHLKYDINVFRERACFYLRKNRFQFAYAFPRPGTDQWYAGTSMISQRTPRQLAIEPKFKGWEQRFDALCGSAVEVAKVDGFREGWRPVGASLEGRKKWLLYQPKTRRLTIPPMGGDGFRRFPELWRQIEENLL